MSFPVLVGGCGQGRHRVGAMEFLAGPAMAGTVYIQCDTCMKVFILRTGQFDTVHANEKEDSYFAPWPDVPVDPA